MKMCHTKTRIVECRKHRQREGSETQLIEEVDEFYYLGSIVTTNEKSERLIT